MTIQRSFAPTPGSIPEARHFVLDQLPQLPRATREAISLIVSELATNAIVHAATPFTVAVKLATATLTVEVTDHSDGNVILDADPPPPDQLHGRGLLVVSQLAAAWGVIAGSGLPGKTVWATLPLGPGAPPAMALGSART